jgi:signal transduction histidine kinase
MPQTGRSRRFWLLYSLGWLPYWGTFSLVFLISGDVSAARALQGALVNVLPEALLGVGVVRLCQRRPWTGASPGRFVAVHAAGAVLYCALAGALQQTLFTLERGLRDGLWQWAGYDTRILLWQLFLALLVYSVLVSVCSAVQAVERLREQEARAAQAEALQTRAELEALRARLNPHFLFNTLHSLLALVRHDPAAAEEALEQFGDLLRHVLRVQRETLDEVTLAEEWRFVQSYLALERLRLGERLRLEADVAEEALECAVPAFCLQPLVENSIRHALAPRASGGRLGIRMRLDGPELELQVRDDGPGAVAEAVEQGSGLGLRLIRKRLEALHGGAARFEIDTRPGRGWCATLRLPARLGSPQPGGRP